ncbi:MAG: hypothetical protein E5W17_02375, partial [Mesorhizobium sp.]
MKGMPDAVRGAVLPSEMLDMPHARWQVLRHDAVLHPGSHKLKTAAEDFSVVPPFEIRSGAEQRVPF